MTPAQNYAIKHLLKSINALLAVPEVREAAVNWPTDELIEVS